MNHWEILLLCLKRASAQAMLQVTVLQTVFHLVFLVSNSALQHIPFEISMSMTLGQLKGQKKTDIDIG